MGSPHSISGFGGLNPHFNHTLVVRAQPFTAEDIIRRIQLDRVIDINRNSAYNNNFFFGSECNKKIVFWQDEPSGAFSLSK